MGYFIQSVAVICMVLGFVVSGFSSNNFFQAYKSRQDDGFQAMQETGKEKTASILKYVGKEGEDHDQLKIDYVKENQIKLACYGVAFGVASLQFLGSLFICLSGETEGIALKMYGLLNLVVMVVLASVCGCFSSSGTSINFQDKKVRNFLIASIVDLGFLLIFVVGVLVAPGRKSSSV